MYKRMGKVVIKILQGNAVNKVTNRVRWANYSSPVANFLLCACQNNYKG